MEANKYRHTIVIGGTGMLRTASAELATISQRLTSIARTQRSLATLDKMLPEDSGLHHMLKLNWSSNDFSQKIKQHIAETELPDLVIAWIHDDQLTLRLAAEFNESQKFVRFFHVIGSAATNPLSIANSLLEHFNTSSILGYYQVILAAKNTEMGSRWLTNKEISNDMLNAIQKEKNQFVVGTLDRWNNSR